MTIRRADPKQFEVEWLDGEKEPDVVPNPAYPQGKDINGVPKGETGCRVTLPHPAPRCGVFRVVCRLCGIRVGVTTAGRPDDPRSVAIPCKTGVPAAAPGAVKG